jgi:hypothetical protein
MRTSMVSEFRDVTGALGAIELNHHFTTVGALCAALARLPGIEFEPPAASFWAQGPNRFTFKGHLYDVSAPHEDIRVAAVEPGAAYRETDDLLHLIAEHLVPKWQNRARSRFMRV